MEHAYHQPRRGLMRCPVCGTSFHPEVSTTMPFCSSRCRTIDLGRWFGEEIGIPLNPELDVEDVDEPDNEYPG